MVERKLRYGLVRHVAAATDSPPRTDAPYVRSASLHSFDVALACAFDDGARRVVQLEQREADETQQ